MVPIWLSIIGYWNTKIERLPYEISSLSQLPAILKRINHDGGADSAHTNRPSVRKARGIYRMEEKG